MPTQSEAMGTESSEDVWYAPDKLAKDPSVNL